MRSRVIPSLDEFLKRRIVIQRLDRRPLPSHMGVQVDLRCLDGVVPEQVPERLKVGCSYPRVQTRTCDAAGGECRALGRRDPPLKQIAKLAVGDGLIAVSIPVLLVVVICTNRNDGQPPPFPPTLD